MKVRLLVLLVISTCFHSSHPSGNVPPAPEITLADIDVELDEKEDQQIDLFKGPLVTCVDEDPTRAYIKTVSPSSPCGKKCFTLLPCGGAGNASEFCLFFLPGEGSLNYAQASSYKLTIACTDDVEPESTKQMTVTIVPNTPPLFVPAVPLSVPKTISGTSAAGSILYDIDAEDIDGDPVYYTMATSPNTQYFSIGYTNGKIQATNDLRYLCQSKVTAAVRASDNINPTIGPKTIEFTVDPHNAATNVTNLDQTITVDENVGAGFSVLGLKLQDDSIGLTSIRMTSVSSAGLELYTLDPATNTIKTKINPDYERSDTRSVKLYFDVTDGFCPSQQYSLTINVKDINEPPVCYPPVRAQIDVYEEDIDTPTGVTVTDPDIGDVITYTKISGDNSLNVRPSSGEIYTVTPLDIDKNVPLKTYPVVYKATDKGGKSCTVTVTLSVHDKNDNPPYCKPNAYSFAATECTELGTVLGKVTGDDDDSSYQLNDKFYFGGGGGKMAVMSNGNVVLTQACVNGESDSGSATITDMGEYPGPLTGIPATLTLTCGPCPPPTPAPVPATTTTKAPTTVKATAKTTVASTTSGGGSGITDLLAWMIPAIIGGLLWLALTAYFIYRYCFPCRNPCAGRCVRRPKVPKAPAQPKPKPVKPEKPKKVAAPPPPPPAPPKPLPPPPPPPPPEPVPDPYLFGFWKEQFTDQDHLKQPARAVKPEPIENMPPAEVVPRGNAIPPENLKLGNPGPGQFNPKPAGAPANNVPTVVQAAPKKSNCVIS
ncbi:unnamed protein product [Lymnaea stagnalis]|uniref:Cadherin domain-containing protein n=1 Tax=Lymnaea stagnalis TaxID=6523 RepID=A0AAV2HLY5_LYMST